jgi:putative transposase
MLVYEYELRLSRAQQTAMDEAIRTTQFIRNKAVRLWMDGRGVSANDLQLLCARLAHEYPFAATLNSQARQAAAARAWAAIERFYTNCREQRPGKKGYPRFQRDCRSVEHNQTGWQLDPEDKRLTLTDGGGIGPVRLIGSRDLATFPHEQIKRVRLLRRADGSSAQFVLQVERRSEHVPTGAEAGIDVGIAAYLTDSNGQAVANPRFIRLAEARLKRSQRRLSRRSVYHKKGKQPRNNHAARQRARQNQYPKDRAASALLSPSPHAPAIPSFQRQSANWGKAKQPVGRAYLHLQHLQRRREDFARKTASALISSHDLIALEDLQVRNLVRNLVRNRRLAKAISDVGWSRLRRWVEDDGRLHEVPVVAVPPAYTSQDCSGVLPNGKPCPARIQKSLSMRTHLCPRCGLILDRDENAAVNILARGVALAREQGRWAQEAGEPTEPSEPKGAVGHTGTERLGTAGLLRVVARRRVATAGGSRNLPDSSGQSVNREQIAGGDDDRGHSCAACG